MSKLNIFSAFEPVHVEIFCSNLPHHVNTETEIPDLIPIRVEANRETIKEVQKGKPPILTK